mgnify:FL=1|tara:strand:+ start:395 stop:616 length:222 start_codon:yes stop_codon:yes gene_type:complete
MKTLNELIDQIAKKYEIPAIVIDGAKELDLRCLKHVGGIVGSRSAKISPTEIHEVTKWGICNDLSLYGEIRKA